APRRVLPSASASRTRFSFDTLSSARPTASPASRAGTATAPSASATTRSPGRTGEPADNGGLPPRGHRESALDVQRQQPAAPHRVAEGGDHLRVTAVPIDQGAAGPPGEGRRGEQLSPAGSTGRAARRDEDHVIRRDVVH